MNRIITILVTIFILLLLYIWISHVWGNDKPRHPRQIVDATENSVEDDLLADADTSYTTTSDYSTEVPKANDEYATEHKIDASEDLNTGPARTEPVTEKKMTETKPVEPKTEPAAKKATPAATVPAKKVEELIKTETKPVIASSAAEGQHLVIAGNFTQLVNAQQRVQELKKAGFPEAEVVNFDLSEYHTVCAGRFSDVNEARRLVKKLKDYHKIDAYVRIGS